MPDKALNIHGDATAFYDLHPVLRALLIADGTVTMAIEAIYRERISVNAISQAFISAPDDISLLGVKRGEEIFYREVELVGGSTDKGYVHAYSLLKQSAIGPELWEQLKSEKIGMGVVLRSAAQSSFRQVVHIGGGNLEGQDDCVHRSYSVQIEGDPAILITEVFNLKAFASGYKS